MNRAKKFDCVEITRDIRNKLYKDRKNKSIDEYFKYLKKEARNSPLWNQFRKMKPYSSYTFSNEQLVISDNKD